MCLPLACQYWLSQWLLTLAPLPLTHPQVSLDDDTLDKQEMLDVFKLDPEYEKNEKLWISIRNEILGVESSDEDSSSDDDSDDDGSAGGDEASDGDEEEEEAEAEAVVQYQADGQEIEDLTDFDVVNLRRTVRWH